ncbi:MULTISPECIES: UPF0182 family protein [Trichocoleus]|uniref:UPF0182 protein NC998_21605 n=1 Tax=Trichocoleus desertorum GB2-A4 TaxID=2933944 RepID=A0ABV0JD40_9CYAN|nr:UPF0182 family protein [Trichocoleus sp. FACHB-46]MBD1864343.1 UPF0182 family protein [Trichocoleus sp. FACHB-46]
MGKSWFRTVSQVVVFLVGLWLAFDLLARLGGEVLWFQELGYSPAFLLRVWTKACLWTIACLVTVGFWFGNFAIAQRLQYQRPQEQDLSPKDILLGNRVARPRGLGVTKLLPLAVGLNLLVGVMLLYYAQVAGRYWHPPSWLGKAFASFSNASLPSPQRLEPEIIWQILVQLPTHLPQAAVLGGLVLGLTIAPRFWLRAIAVVLAVGFGVTLDGHWAQVLQYFYPTSFNSTDPLFGRDISFYVFTLPVQQLLAFWLTGLTLYALVSVTLWYLLSGESLSEGNFPGFSAPQVRHLQGLSTSLMVAIAFSHWLSRYELLYSSRGVVYGASYTDVTVQLPINTGLSFLALAIAVFLLWRTIVGSKRASQSAPWLYGLSLYVAVVAIAGIALPEAVHRFAVQPNELARERPYIERSITLTRQAFDLQAIDAQTFSPTGELTRTDLQANQLTLRNIRLWDTRPLLQTNRQLQQIRLYYRFPDADVDRYTLLKDEGGRTFAKRSEGRDDIASSLLTPNSTLQERFQRTPFTTEKQQVLISARELDYSAVPQQAKTWVNEHLVYTHGYGFTLSPVNRVGPGGLPDYFVKDIGVNPADDNASSLTTSSAGIRASIPIGQPRLYYGEIANTYVMTGTRVKELDYPSGNDNVYNTYGGRGGVFLNSQWRRLLFAKYLNDWQMVLTRNFTPQTKVLFRRNINQRIRAIAPFLRYDSEPYLITADTNPEANAGDDSADQNYLYWMVDAYTTSDRYPYSDPGNHPFNYIRNSVKVVIDAYNGSVDFYVADLTDPIIQTWARIFPGLFKPISDMPAALLSHVRYPVDFFNVQSERLLTYHMTDPQVFYNREDQWQVPVEIYGSKPQLVEPYYLITSLPGSDTEEFILLLPFTPRQRNNLIAWLAARSDGENYGKLLLYEFPKQQLVYGPEQIEARINQDPIISQQISLWNRQGSRAIQGNLLVIPIEQSLLYVEPLYLEAEQNSLPTLVRVIVAYENRIVMAETFDQALAAVFEAKAPTAPVVRPVAAPTPPTPSPVPSTP